MVIVIGEKFEDYLVILYSFNDYKVLKNGFSRKTIMMHDEK